MRKTEKLKFSIENGKVILKLGYFIKVIYEKSIALLLVLAIAFMAFEELRKVLRAVL